MTRPADFLRYRGVLVRGSLYLERSVSVEGKFLFAAAQAPFDAGGNQFCTLAPIWSSDGEVIAKRDFPNRQLCWFLLRDAQFQDLTPGQLVFGGTEPTKDHGTSAPDKEWWQLKSDGAMLAGSPGSVLEILDAGTAEPDDPRTLIEPRREFELDHRPSTLVLVALDRWLYGPFRPRIRRGGGDTEGLWHFALERTFSKHCLESGAP